MNADEELRAEIERCAIELDARYGNQPGTALRAIYSYYFDVEHISVEVLQNLYADALQWLRDAA